MSSESYFKVPKEQDFLKIIEDAEEAGVLDKAATAVNNPLSWLRFIPSIGVGIRQAEKEAEAQGKQSPLFEKGFKETDEERDLAKELDRAIIGGGVKSVKALLEFATLGIDLSGKTQLTNKLDTATRNFLLDHGNPNTWQGDLTEIGIQYGLGGGAVLKILKNIGNIKKIKSFSSAFEKGVGKIKNKYLRGTVQTLIPGAGSTILKDGTKASSLATRVGKGGLSLSIADMAISDSDRPTIFVDKVKEEGLSGQELAVARLINKFKFAQEGAIIGGGIPLVGKSLNLGARYSLWTTGKVIGIGAKTANALVVNPISKIAALDPIVLPTIAKGLKQAPQIAGKAIKPLVPKSVKELPDYKDWRMFSVESADPLRRTLKKVDNGLSWLRSIGKNTPEMAAISIRGEKEMVSKARVIEKLLDSIEKKTYDLVKASKKMYDTKLTSPASQDKYLDDILEYFKGQRQLKALPKTLQSTAKLLNDELMEVKNTFAKILPKDSLIKDTLMNNIRGYMRKSYAVFTNPNYSVDESSKVFKDAVDFFVRLSKKNRAMKDTAKQIAKRDGLPIKQATEKLARDEVNDLLRFAKTDNRDPIQTLTEISKKRLRSDKVISTGEELPEVIANVLGKDNNLKNTVLQTVSNLSTQTTNKMMFDRLGELMVRTGQLFKTREAAELAYRITPDKLGKGVRQVGKIDGIGLLKTETSKLYGPIDLINDITTMKGPLDDLAQNFLYKNLLIRPKVAVQYGKTVLSPATQSRNFTFASMFVMNRGLIGGRASMMDSVKMAVDDIFNAGKLGADAEKRLLDDVAEGIKYGALDENLVAAELTAVLRLIKNQSIKDTDQLTKYLETKGLLKTASRIYAGGDNVWKWFAYNWYKSFLTDFAKKDLKRMSTWFDEIAGQKLPKTKFDGTKMDLDEAIKLGAAYYVRNTMPTYSLVPKIIQTLKATPLGNFVSFPSEMIRTSFNTLRVNLREMSSSDPIMRSMGIRGAMGQFTVMGGISMATHGIYNGITGISEELMDKYKMYVAPEFQRNSDLVPISTVDENGVFKVVDLSTLIGYDTVIRPFEAAINKFKRQKANPQDVDKFIMDMMFSPTGPFGELLAPFLNKTIYLETISEITNNKKKTGGKIYSELAVENGDYEEIFAKSLAHLFGTFGQGGALEPGAITTARQLYYGFREKLTGTGSSYDLEDVLMGLFTGIKPLKVDLKRSMNFFVTDLKNIRTEAPQASNMYKFNRTKAEILSDFIQQQRLAWRQQQKLYQAFNTMIELGLDEDFIFDEAEARRLPSGQIDMSIDGEFRPLSFSIPRFESKIEEIEDNMDKTGSKRSINEDALFPEDELEDIIDELEDADLNGEFPFDEREVYRDGLTSIQLPTSIKADRTTAKLPVPPLPPQPAPVNIKTVQAPVNQATGLTSTETALLSPGEQAIRLKQKGLA